MGSADSIEMSAILTELEREVVKETLKEEEEIVWTDIPVEFRLARKRFEGLL